MRAIPLALLAALLARAALALPLGDGPPPPAAGEAQEVRQPAPDFSFTSQSGQEVRLRPLARAEMEMRRKTGEPPPRVLAGKPVLVYFWGTWPCPGCPEMPQRGETLQGLFPGKLTVVGFAVGPNLEKVKEAVREAARNKAHLLAAGGDAAKAYQPNVPAWVLIDAAGNIAYRPTGNPDNDRLRGEIGKLTGQ